MDSVPEPSDSNVAISYLDQNAECFVPARDDSLALSGSALTEAIRQKGLELGLVRVGFTRATAFDDAKIAFERWLAAGYAGSMGYLEELGDRSDPRRLLPNARTVLVAAMPTTGPIHENAAFDEGVVADYAIGLDYHIALRGRLQRLSQALADFSGQSVWCRPCVDTAPLLEREAARRAGIGFIAKSTMLIIPGLGPRVMLGALVTDLDLEPGVPLESRCGRCTACLDACPSKAFVAPFVLDARKCVSYLSIEHQGNLAKELRPAMGNRLVGCDICQSVCPYDRIASAHVMPTDNAPRPLLVNPKLEKWLEMSSTDYRRISKRSALRRLGRVQLMRNAAIALGNSQRSEFSGVLGRALLHPISEIVRAHAAWALGKLRCAEARVHLERAIPNETDPWVRSEIENALREMS